MCCGRSNQPIIKAPRPTPGAAAISRARPANMAQTSRPQFEYVGKTALTVVSPYTGKHYRFARPGARLDVDIKDRSWLAFVPNLQRVT